MKSLWTKESYIAAHPDRHWLLRCLHGFSVLRYIPDILHTKHLGTDKFYFGVILELLCFHIIQGGVDPDLNLDVVWDDISSFYADLKTRNRYHELKQSMIHPNGKNFLN